MNFIKINNKKRPVTPFEKKFYSNNYNQWNNVGFIIGKDLIVLDFDGDNDNEDKLVDYIEKTYPTLTIKTTRGKHFYYKMPSNHSFSKIIDGISCLGFQCDYLTGEKSLATIKIDGKLREMNMPFSEDNMSLLPEELYPLKKGKKLSGMNNGDGRNNSLYAHLLAIRESFPEIDINTLSREINTSIFDKSLDKDELIGIVKSAKKKQIKIKAERKSIVYSSFEELERRNLPPVIFYVDKMIPQGLTIISSLPKIGKSWLALDMGMSIANGTSFLGFNTRQSEVLYLALEDSENRLKERSNKILKGQKAPHNFIYSIRCPDIKNGLLEELEELKQKEPNLKVIIIDTMQKIRSVYNGTNVYGNDYGELGGLKGFADKYSMSIILIHHVKKGKDEDVFSKISGTNGITGTADTMIVISKNDRFDTDAVLSISGRDVEQNEYIIRFEKESFKWRMISRKADVEEELEKQDYENNPIVKIIKDNIAKNNGTWETTCKEFEEELFNNYSDIIDTTINSKKLKPLKNQLKKYDGIIYFMSGPRNGKRPLIFKKIVDIVENVESKSTNSTKTTNNKGDV